MRGYWLSQTMKCMKHYQSAGNSGVHRIMYSTYPVSSVVWGQTNPTTARTGENVRIYCYSPNYSNICVNIILQDGTRIPHTVLTWFGSGSNRYFLYTMPAQNVSIIATATNNRLRLANVPIDTTQHLIELMEVTPNDQPYMLFAEQAQQNYKVEDYMYTPNTQVKIKVTATPPSYISSVSMMYTTGPYAGTTESATAQQITNGYIYTFNMQSGNAQFTVNWGQ